MATCSKCGCSIGADSGVTVRMTVDAVDGMPGPSDALLCPRCASGSSAWVLLGIAVTACLLVFAAVLYIQR